MVECKRRAVVGTMLSCSPVAESAQQGDQDRYARGASRSLASEDSLGSRGAERFGIGGHPPLGFVGFRLEARRRGRNLLFRLRARTREDVGARLHRRAARLVHLAVHLRSRGGGLALELGRGGRRFARRSLRQFPRGPRGLFALLRDALDRPEDEPVEQHGQDEQEKNDPEDGQIREHDTSDCKRTARAAGWRANVNLYHPDRRRSKGRPSSPAYRMSSRGPCGAVTRPTRHAPQPASRRRDSAAPAAALSIAQNSPPDVCGSCTSRATSASTSAAKRTPAEKCCAFVRPPPGVFCAAIARTPSRSGTRLDSISIVTWLATAMAEACPTRPNPVTSVHARTAPPNDCSTAAASPFSV